MIHKLVCAGLLRTQDTEKITKVIFIFYKIMKRLKTAKNYSKFIFVFKQRLTYECFVILDNLIKLYFLYN